MSTTWIPNTSHSETRPPPLLHPHTHRHTPPHFPNTPALTHPLSPEPKLPLQLRSIYGPAQVSHHAPAPPYGPRHSNGSGLGLAQSHLLYFEEGGQGLVKVWEVSSGVDLQVGRGRKGLGISCAEGGSWGLVGSKGEVAAREGAHQTGAAVS